MNTLDGALGGAPISDANDVTYRTNKLQVFRVSNSTLNLPITMHGFILHMDIDSQSYAIQTYIPLDDTAHIHRRRKAAGVWGDWHTNS